MFDSKARSSRRRTWLIIGIVAVGLIAAALYWLFDTSALDRELAALRSQGLPTNATELNAFYSVPAGVTDTTELWTAAVSAVAAANIEQRAANLPFLGSGSTPVPEPGTEWAEREASRTFLNELDQELQAIMRAADAGGMARFPVDFSGGANTLLTHAQETRTIARLLTLNAHIHAHDGEDQQVLRDVTAIFAVSDSLSGEPTMISQLVRIAVHAIGCQLAVQMLPHSKWSEEELKNLQMSIGHARFRQEMLNAIHGERALFLSSNNVGSVVLFRDANSLKANELFRMSADGLAKSWPEAIRKHQEIDTQIKTMASGAISRLKFMSVMLMLPALEHAVFAGARAEARQNCALATIAAQRYRLQHGRLPKLLADIDALIPGDSSDRSARFTDPFDGLPLRFKSEDSRLLIYSVGDNLTDDGGIVDGKGIPLEGDLGYSVAK